MPVTYQMRLLVTFLAVARAYIAPRPTSRPVPRPASPITDQETSIDLDWRSFRAKLEATGLDATAATLSRLVKRKSSKRNGADAAQRGRRDDGRHGSNRED